MVVAIVALAATRLPAQSVELTPNTRFFTVQNYYAPNSDGDYVPYRASGFYEPGAANVRPRLFLLPQIQIDRSRVRYFDSDGNRIDPALLSASRVVRSINVPLTYQGGLPNEAQSVGIAVQTGGQPQTRYMIPPLKDNFGRPMIAPWAQNNPFLVQEIFRRTAEYELQVLSRQNVNIQRYATYQVESVNINNLSLAILIDGQVIGERTVDGSVILAGSTFPPLVVMDPTVATVNRIRNGDFETQIRYRFRDAKVGAINASFDVRAVIEDYIRHSQQVITSNRTSGWQILGFGSRRNRVRQSLNEQITRQASQHRQANTVIVMDDATEDQIRRFEETFFPRASEQQTIQAHLSAAAQARAAGKNELADAHQKYAEALQQGIQLAEVDAVGAAAALNAGDYASFIAKGVRWGSEQNSSSASFVRVTTETVTTSNTQQWTDVDRRSVQREVTIVLLPEEEREQRARFGICGYTNGMFPGTFFITCLEAGSPMASAGALPGEMVVRIAGRAFSNQTQLDAIIRRLEPGQLVSVTFVDPFGFELNRQVLLSRGEPVN